MVTNTRFTNIITRSIANSAVTNEGPGLPFPGYIGQDGKHLIRYLTLDGQRKTVLKDWCQEFHLPYSGNIEALTNRLKAFSADQQAWDSLIPGARRAHKGARLGLKLSRPKQSVNRRAELLDITDSGQKIRHALPTERSKDTRTAEQVNQLIPWAENIVTRFPYHKREILDIPPAPPTTPINTGSSESVHSQLMLANSQLQTLLLHIQTSQVSHIPTVSTNVDADISMSAPATTSEIIVPIGGTTRSSTSAGVVVRDGIILPTRSTVSGPALTLELPVSAPSALLAEPSASVSHEDCIRSFKLLDGSIFTFTQSQVPDPPAISFAADIPRLNAMWDDDPNHWRGESVPVIEGFPIPLVYWPEIYRYGKKNQWKGTKAKWFEWKVVVEHWRKGTPAQFWAEFSNADGKPFSFTAISRSLREQRMAEDKVISEQAQAEYGDQFTTLFHYRRGGKTYVMSDDTSIANRYREMHKN